MAFKKLKYWFDQELAEMLSDKILGEDSNFPRDQFVSTIVGKIDALELKDRVEHIADAFHTHLGNSIPENIKILIAITYTF